MEAGNMGLLPPSGSSTTGSMSTITNKDTSSELELGLGLSLGTFKSKPYSRIFTAQDFPNSLLENSSSSSSPSPSPSVGTKRTASPPPTSTSQVVGWPPVKAYRMNSLVNQAKQPTNEEFSSKNEESKTKNNGILDQGSNNKNNNNVRKEKGVAVKNSQFVKVNIDGSLIGRKVDLNAHRCYETLALTLNNMFCRRSSTEENDTKTKEMSALALLDGSSEFVLTYEDKDGDWMLVGDVPWRMFINSVKRLRIMRTVEANGLDPSFQERNGRPRTKAV